MSTDSDLKARREFMLKMRDDCANRGFPDAAFAYNQQAMMINLERMQESSEKLRDLAQRKKPA